MISFRLLIVVFTATFHFKFYEATHRCASEVCMDSKIDIKRELRERVNVTSGPEGERVYFKPGLFSFGCSYFNMYKDCIPTGVDPCFPRKYQNRLQDFIDALDNIACTKAERLDKLIDCMNNGDVQKFLFENLYSKLISFESKMKTNDSDVCSKMKVDIRAAVTNLSANCDHDGLQALLQLMNELAEEIPDIFQIVTGELMTKPDYKQNCYDEFMEVTSSVQRSLTRRASVMETSRIVRSLLGL
ncbi:uncharacterized protein LOC134234983 [Saccostrea cucullata]|uniref:uncharacterized protein LOC134234983 n=1 Tax=Saccostrea cuccullata TaxID=36930 RepID=UPI002ED08F35